MHINYRTKSFCFKINQLKKNQFIINQGSLFNEHWNKDYIIDHAVSTRMNLYKNIQFIKTIFSSSYFSFDIKTHTPNVTHIFINRVFLLSRFNLQYFLNVIICNSFMLSIWYQNEWSFHIPWYINIGHLPMVLILFTSQCQ